MLFSLLITQEAQAAWLTGWDYRKSHTINATTGAGTNYQVRVVVYYGSGSDSGEDVYLSNKCETDFVDIRFTDDDGNTELDYWMQEKTDSDNAIFWVEVADDLDSSQTIYVYYGNSGVSSTSSGADTFIFFDDFNDGNADGWTEHNGTWSVTDYTYYQSGNLGDYMRTSIGESSWTDYVLETKIKIAAGGATGGFAGVLFRFQDTSNHYAVILDDRSDDSIWIRQWINNSYSTSPQEWADVTIDRDTWYDLRVDIFDDGANDTIRCRFGGITHEYSYTQYASGKIALMMHGTQGYYDDVRVRKYVSPEPAHGSWGSEETSGAPAAVLRLEGLKIEGMKLE